jgi:competence ComEA-like helix-hairpin-helix protein
MIEKVPATAHREVRKIGSKIYSTAESGDITITTDGIKHSVSVAPWTPPVEPDPNPDTGVGYPVNINTASYERLQEITGVGPVIALRIIEYRDVYGPFKTKDALKNVKGIGDKTYLKMVNQISI